MHCIHDISHTISEMDQHEPAIGTFLFLLPLLFLYNSFPPMFSFSKTSNFLCQELDTKWWGMYWPSIYIMVGQLVFFLIFFSFIFISWRLITLQYCSGFCHTLTWISHGFTCIPHPDPPLSPPSWPDPFGSFQCTRSEHLSHASNLGWWSVSP